MTSKGDIDRVRLTMLAPAATQTITSSFRQWGCSPRNYIRNSDDENNEHEVSDDGAASDNSSVVRKADGSGQCEEDRRM